MLCCAVQLYTNEYARFLFRLPSSFLPSSRMHVCMHAWLGFSGSGAAAAAIIVVVFVFMEREEFKKKKKGDGRWERLAR